MLQNSVVRIDTEFEAVSVLDRYGVVKGGQGPDSSDPAFLLSIV